MRNEFRTWPKTDTLTAKKKIVRKVRTAVRKMNRVINKNFDGRYWIEIIRQDIIPFSDNSGWDAYFWISFHDNEDNSHVRTYTYNPHEIIYSGLFAGGNHLDTDFNSFIHNA